MRRRCRVLEIPIRSVVVTAEGDVDLRGTLGVADGRTVASRISAWRSISIRRLAAAFSQLVELTDKYCVIFQTIQNSPRTSVQMRRMRVLEPHFQAQMIVVRR